MIDKAFLLLCLLALCTFQVSAGVEEASDAVTSKPNEQHVEESASQKCNTLGGKAGQCVPFYLCEAPESLAGDLIDVRLPEPCSSYIEVCCELKNTVTSLPPTSTKEPEQGKS